MLIPQQIYDLDTITLQQKTQELIKKIAIAGNNCPKHLHQTLELAKLQIQQRKSIEQFGLNLQQQFLKFDKLCLYPEELIISKTEKLIEVNKINNNETPSQQKSVKNLSQVIKYKIPQRSILELLKNTKIQTQRFIIGKSSIKNINVTKRKTMQSTKKNMSSERTIKKLPSIKMFQKTKKSQIQIKEKNKLSQNPKNIIRNPIQTKIQFKSNQNSKSNDTKKRMPVKNNIKFIQNDFYSSSEEQIEIQQIAKLQPKPQKQTYKTEQKQSIDPQISDETIFLFKKSQDLISQHIQVTSQSKNLNQEQEIKNPKTEPKQQKRQQKIETISTETKNVYVDNIDYFRLTIIPPRKHLEIKQILQQRAIENIVAQSSNQKKQESVNEISNSNHQSINDVVQNQTNNKQENEYKAQIIQMKQPVLKIQSNQSDLMTQKNKNQLKQQNNIFKIKTKSVNLKNPYKNMLLEKILIQLPSLITQYHQIIPNFSSLFHSQVQVITLLRQLSQMMKQHFETVKPLIHFAPNLYKNTQQFQNYLYKHNDKIRLYGNHVNLNLQEFEFKDEISRLRSNNQIQIPKQQDILYYRVVKTKQQVYDIISSTFNRTQNWAELPHGMNLKSTWNLLWTWAKPQIDFKKLIYFQKVNHFPHNKHLSRKDMLKKNIEKIKRLGIKTQSLFDIIPQSFLLPGENTSFIQKFLYYKQKQGINNLWIMKPIGQSRGRGISLINNLQEILYSQPVVLQKYLKNPLLLDGFKFDMRIYVLLTSINPLEVFVYKEGFARLSTQKYNLNINNLGNNFIHLTNFAIQRQNYVSHGFSLGGTKISLKMLKQKLKEINVDWKNIWNQVIQIILKSNIAAMNQIPPNNNCFQLFGYDIIIDENHKCWLLEINSSPSLQRQFVLDQIIKQQLIDDSIQLLNIVKFDRKRLLQVFQRRILEYEGRKSVINTENNSVLQLNRDLHYILHGQALRKYGEVISSNGNFEMIAPSELYYNIVKIVQTYKITNIIKK